MTRLRDILGMLHIVCEDDREIRGISDDSREVERDWLFVCRFALDEKGIGYVKEAMDKGAVVLMNAKESRKLPEALSFCHDHEKKQCVYTCNEVENLIEALIWLYYGDLCERQCVIGVTGTSGKTSVATIITHILRMEGKRVLRIGTHVVEENDHQETIRNTTPYCFQLANLMKRAIAKNIPYIVMEVSSHAIDQNRIANIRFDLVIYTNITQDHLDYHKTKVHYRYTKYKLRRYMKEQGILLINRDLPYMRELTLLNESSLVTIGTGHGDVTIRDIHLHDQGSVFTLQDVVFSTRLLGMMNVYNAAQALTACHLLGSSWEALRKQLPLVPYIPGRMEILQGSHHHVWIDYAHTPDAVEQLLRFARLVCKGKLYVVLGCGGDRDRDKRPKMAKAACQNSDLAIFTSDNPRYENLSSILLDMCQISETNYEVFENRTFAIKYTIKIAKDSDIIVIAGKGNETTQEVEGNFYAMEDAACVKQHLAKEELFWK